MLALAAVQMILNNLTFCLTISFLILLMWHNARRASIQSFGFFLIGFCVWNLGISFGEVNAHIAPEPRIAYLSAILKEVGFVASAVGIYTFLAVLAGISRIRLRYIAVISIFLIFSYRLFLIVRDPFSASPVSKELSAETFPYIFAFYILFSVASIYTVWSYRGKIASHGVTLGTILFVAAQGFEFTNVGATSPLLLTGLSCVAILVLGLSMIRREIIIPFSERSYQIESLQDVSVAISSQIAIETLLKEIARQAVDWLDADGMAIFLRQDTIANTMQIATVHNLPRQLIGMELGLGQGVSGNAALTKQSILLENYQRDWTGGDDFPLAKETLGSVVAVPLIYASNVIGVLMVVAARHSRKFDVQDAFLLELLAAQAAVAIAHSRLFDQIVEAREQLEAVLSSTENPVVAVNQDKHIIFANLAARSLFQFQDVKFKEDSDLASFIDNWEKSVDGNTNSTYEAEIGDRIYLGHVGSLGGKTVAGWVIIFNDITDLKELDRIKSEMVRMASHDLKNPLMGAMAHLELLRDDLESVQNPELELTVSTIERQLLRMDRIIRGVLDVERLKNVTKRAERIDVQHAIENAIAELNEYITERGVELSLDVEDNIHFFGDVDRCERMLVNLIENAIKFTVTDGRVVIRAYREPDGNAVTFCIEDNGVGIPLELQSRIFDRFFRGEQRGVEHVTGSGLGLSLVKTIVEQHDGQIWLESEENRGTTFWIRFPIRDTDADGVSHSQEKHE